MFSEIEPGLGVRKPGFCCVSQPRLPGGFEHRVFPQMDGRWSRTLHMDRVVM